ncbi:MAG: cob(I)yrinic acid a,c-diamide adenosyltransferase [Andreesenia angusta]|nr:cob(I)yrinic acid a,c-diamide adenosyltransferase [Andreesenia angusta]
MKLKLGLIQIYTGDGKGKTTAAIGQGIRAAGNDLDVYMVQFLKTFFTGELHILDRIDNFEVFRFESEKNFFWNLTEREKKVLQEETDKAICFIEEVIREDKCDVLILDEIFGSLHNGLIDENRILELLKSKPKTMEIILTGRKAPQSFIEIADYVSEIKMRKHPFTEGINSRKGIEY